MRKKRRIIILLIAVCLLSLLAGLMASLNARRAERRDKTTSQEAAVVPPSEENRPEKAERVLSPVRRRTKKEPAERSLCSIGSRGAFRFDLEEPPSEDERMRSLAEDVGRPDSKEEKTISIPPVIEDLERKFKKVRDDFDESTRRTASKALNAIPMVEAEPSEAKLRPSGGGVKLEVVIPSDSIRIGRSRKPR